MEFQPISGIHRQDFLQTCDGSSPKREALAGAPKHLAQKLFRQPTDAADGTLARASDIQDRYPIGDQPGDDSFRIHPLSQIDQQAGPPIAIRQLHGELGSASQVVEMQDERSLRVDDIPLSPNGVFRISRFSQLVAGRDRSVLSQPSARAPAAVGNLQVDRTSRAARFDSGLPTGNNLLELIAIGGSCARTETKSCE